MGALARNMRYGWGHYGFIGPRGADASAGRRWSGKRKGTASE